MTSEFAIAVHTLVFLCYYPGSQSSDKIAQSVCTHPARVRKVLAKLKRSSLVKPKEGSVGGYQLTRAADKINLQQVCLAVGSAPVGVSWKPGSSFVPCPIAHQMGDVIDDIYAQLNVLCFEKLHTLSIADIAQQIQFPD